MPVPPDREGISTSSPWAVQGLAGCKLTLFNTLRRPFSLHLKADGLNVIPAMLSQETVLINWPLKSPEKCVDSH